MIHQLKMRERATAGTRHSGENDCKEANRQHVALKLTIVVLLTTSTNHRKK